METFDQIRETAESKDEAVERCKEVTKKLLEEIWKFSNFPVAHQYSIPWMVNKKAIESGIKLELPKERDR